MEVIGYPFVSHVKQDYRPTISNPKEFLKKHYQNSFSSGLQNLLNNGVYKSMGYIYDFKPYLKQYLYKQYGMWNEAYAPNKTYLRRVIYGKIDKIIMLND